MKNISPIEDRRKLAVVVPGATGKERGAVVKSLLKRGHEVRAITRHTDCIPLEQFLFN